MIRLWSRGRHASNLSASSGTSSNMSMTSRPRSMRQLCRRLLLEWLILSTRYVTALPGPAGLPPLSTARLAQDYKETNLVGIEDRIRRDRLNYL